MQAGAMRGAAMAWVEKRLQIKHVGRTDADAMIPSGSKV